MQKLKLSSDALSPAPTAFSHGVAAGPFVFVSGQVARNKKGEIVGKGDTARQARQVFHNVAAVLETVGATLADVVAVTVYLARMSDYPALQAVRNELFADSRPSSTVVEVAAMTHQEFLVEVTVIAIRHDQEPV